MDKESSRPPRYAASVNRRTALIFCALTGCLGFLLQPLDVLHFSICSSDFYLPGECGSTQSFIANKALRFVLCSTCLLTLLYRFSAMPLKPLIMVACMLVAGFSGALYFALVPSPFHISVYKILHPVLFSPLLAVVYAGCSLPLYHKPH